MWRRLDVPITKLHLRNYATKQDYRKYALILGVNENCDQEELRAAYLILVKKFHPDNGGDAERFREIDRAFRVLTEKKSRERWDVEDEFKVESTINHTVPQHRQYLNYDGVGFGTPYQRQKQYQQVRALKAAQNVMEHRINKATTANKNALWDKSKPKYKHDIKTKYGFDRLVEDLIQESMSKGEFSNLSGCGKPLKDNKDRNPFVDLMTQKLNEVLIDNGFTPDWISLHKEIRENIEILRNGLTMERSYFGPCPLNNQDTLLWKNAVKKYEKLMNNINGKINKFNLVVPILNKQMFHINLEREANKILLNGKHAIATDYPPQKTQEMKTEETEKKENFIFDFLTVIFK